MSSSKLGASSRLLLDMRPDGSSGEWRRFMPVVTTDAVMQGQVNKGADVTAKKAGDLAAATFHLYTNNLVPGPQNVLGDFTEAVFTGYVPIAAAGWNANEFAADGSVST